MALIITALSAKATLAMNSQLQKQGNQKSGKLASLQFILSSVYLLSTFYEGFQMVSGFLKNWKLYAW